MDEELFADIIGEGIDEEALEGFDEEFDYVDEAETIHALIGDEILFDSWRNE